jgi:hypothetical protein
MASEFYGINRGQLDGPIYLNVVAGTSTGGGDIELRVDVGKGTTRKDIMVALESFKQFILGQGGTLGSVFPPI